MYAIIATGGKQYKVSEGDIITIEKLGVDAGEKVTFDQKDISHALDLGADGVQIASRFVATEECDASEAYKEAYIHASEENIEIIQSPVGMPGRALRNKFIDRVKRAKLPVSKCYNCLEKCSPQKVPYCITKALIDGNEKKKTKNTDRAVFEICGVILSGYVRNRNVLSGVSGIKSNDRIYAACQLCGAATDGPYGRN